MYWSCWNTLNCSLLSSFCVSFRRYFSINIPPTCIPPVKSHALQGILSSGGNFCIMLQWYVTRTCPSLKSYKSTKWGQVWVFLHVVTAKKKINCLMVPTGKNQRKGEKGRKPWHCSVMLIQLWSSVVERVLLLVMVYQRQRRPVCRNLYLCLRNVNMLRWIPLEGFWSLWSAVCSALPRTCSFQHLAV